MGKYPHSKLHSAFSDWHIKKCKKTSYLCDIDRIWVEMRYGKGPIAVFDLKTETDTLSKAGEILGQWFEAHEIPFYIIQVRFTDVESRQFKVWNCYRPKTDEFVLRTEYQMIDWINNLGELEK